MAKSTETAPEVIQGNESITNSGRWTTHIGFALMLAWHYLILFSPAFGDIDHDSGFGYLFLRQLSLYIAIAISFSAIWLHGRWRVRRGLTEPSFRAPILPVGIGCFLLSLLYVGAPLIDEPLPLRLALIGALGILQAYLMILWVRCLMHKGSGHVLPSFGIYMIAGGAVALLICFFQWPLQGIMTSILPLATAVFLAYEKSQDKASLGEGDSAAQTVQEETGANAAEKAEADRSATAMGDEELLGTEADAPKLALLSSQNKRMILFSGLFAFTFGLLQGSFIVAHIPILIVGDAIVLVGIIFAGLLIQIIPKNIGVTLCVDMMHRFSLILFVVGSIVITWNHLGFLPLLFSQIALLAGFNLFDFGVFAYGIEGHWGGTRRLNGADFARPIVYLGMTLGLLLGWFVISHTGVSRLSATLLLICGVAVILMVATTLMPIYHHEPTGNAEATDAAPASSAEGTEKNEQAVVVSLSAFPSETFDARKQDDSAPKRHESPWRNACKQIAKWYQLSPRETEIFMLVAKGRNADYIQQSLTISTHTAKTHIANIYHKLDVHSMQEVLDLVEKYRDNNEKDREGRR